MPLVLVIKVFLKGPVYKRKRNTTKVTLPRDVSARLSIDNDDNKSWSNTQDGTVTGLINVETFCKGTKLLVYYYKIVIALAFKKKKMYY